MLDLLVEYYEDRFIESPVEQYRNEDGHVQFTDTGDEVIDKWEQLIAEGRGSEVDLWEAFTEEEKVSMTKWLKERPKSRTIGSTVTKEEKMLESMYLPKSDKTGSITVPKKLFGDE